MRTNIFAVTILSLFFLQSAIAQQSIVGHWEGSIKIQGQELMINVDFKTADSGLSATIDIPQQKGKGLPLKNVRYEYPKVHFELPAGPGLAVFDGERNDSTIAGTFMQAGMSGTFSIMLSNANERENVEEPPPAYKPVVGLWSGAIDIGGQSLGMSVTFQMKSGALRAFIDIPEQHATGLLLTKVSFENPRVHFELPAGPGLAIFDGTWKNDSLKGGFTQASNVGSFYLVRGPAKKVEEPEEVVPYKKEEVFFYDDSIKLAGTLTIPPTQGPHPAVVMITGSGPQNRDEELFGFKPFKIIADHFTRKGIAVLRYDDRGVGGSTGNTNQSTTADFARDALAAIHFLQSRSDINPTQIGLCGHSEGGIVGPLAASQSSDVDFVICIAGTGVPGWKIVLAQDDLIMRADSTSEEKIWQALALERKMLDAALRGENLDGFRQEMLDTARKEFETMPEEQRKMITDKEQYLNDAVDTQLRSMQSPWFKYFIAYDPAPALEKVKCPILALFGGLDLQVPAELNKNAMEAALKQGGNKDYTFRVFPKANHLFLTATTGSPKEYGTLKKEFVPGFLDTMSDWILKRVTLPK